MKSKFALVLLTLFVLAALAACKKSSNSAPPPSFKNSLVYIYNADSTDGVAFKQLLQANGCSVTLVNKSNAATLDYSGYNMIVVGHNTDTLHSPVPWSSTNAGPVKNSGKPILMIGEGGSLFAGAIQDTVNWGSSAGSFLAIFKATDPTNSLYKQPKTITIGADSLVTMYSASSKLISFYSKNSPINNVVFLGREADVSASKYYPITVANAKYTTFGFYDNTDKMTSAGKDFFVNLVYYAGNLTL